MSRLANPLFGFDYTSEIDTGTLHGYGARFVVRYLSRYGWKVLGGGEYQRLKAAGIGVALVFEDSAARAQDGYDAGVADAQFALRQAHDICGRPAIPRPISSAVDYDTAGNPGATDGYFDGWGAVMSKRLSGPYGGFEVCSHQANRGSGYLFQTYAWSYGRLDTRAQIYQYSNDHPIGGGGVDYDHAFFADYGQWNIGPVYHDPYGLFENTWYVFNKGRQANGLVLKHTTHLNEHVEAKRTDILLKHPRANHKVLKQEWVKLKLLRDRIWSVAHQGGRVDWHTANRRSRWHALNNRMNKIKR